MFQFPRFPSPLKAGMPGLFIRAGYPIRRSPAELARQLTEAYRSRATSFIGPQRLGIHRAPLVALTTIPLPPQRVVGIPQVTLYSFVNVLSGFPPGLPGRKGSARGVRGQDVPRKGRPSGRPRTHQTFSPSVYSVVEGLSLKLTPSRQAESLVEPGGLEPPTSALQRRRSPS